MEKKLKKEIEQKIKVLEEKEQEFTARQEFGRATTARIVCSFLKDYVVENDGHE